MVAQAPAGQLAAELADVMEVLQALAEAHDITWDQVVKTAADKRAGRGGFRNRILTAQTGSTPNRSR